MVEEAGTPPFSAGEKAREVMGLSGCGAVPGGS